MLRERLRVEAREDRCKLRPFKGHGVHLLAVDDLAHLAAVSLEMDRAVAYRDRVGSLANLQRDVDQNGCRCRAPCRCGGRV